MYIKDKHESDKAVSAQVLFKGESGAAVALQIRAGEQLSEHNTKTAAMLLCVSGEVVFENENGRKEILLPGGYIDIEPMIKHWVDGVEDSQLVLMK